MESTKTNTAADRINFDIFNLLVILYYIQINTLVQDVNENLIDID